MGDAAVHSHPDVAAWVRSHLTHPTHRCAHERPVGGSPKWSRADGSHDGEWTVCFDQGVLTKPGCVVYSFGVGGDWSFDEAMAQGDHFGVSGRRFRGVGCSVHCGTSQNSQRGSELVV